MRGEGVRSLAAPNAPRMSMPRTWMSRLIHAASVATAPYTGWRARPENRTEGVAPAEAMVLR